MHHDLPETSAPGGETTGRRLHHREILLSAACLGWALIFVLCLHALRADAVPAGPALWGLAALPAVLALLFLFAFMRYLAGTDELQRLIQLQAMAVGFGGGFFVLCCYELFEEVGAPAASTLDLASVLPVLYALGVLAGWVRYQ